MATDQQKAAVGPHVARIATSHQSQLLTGEDMQPITIAALCIAAIAIVIAAVAMECAIRMRRTANRQHRRRIMAAARCMRLREAVRRRDHLINLERKEAFLDRERLVACERRFGERGGLVRQLNNELAEMQVKLARMDASQRPRATGGRFGAKVAA